MAFILHNRLQETYDAVALFVREAMRSDGSLFTPGQSIWTLANIEEFSQRFVLSPDESNADFMTKFRKQLTGSGDQTIQLAAEMLYVQCITPAHMHAPRKLSLVNDVLALLSTPLAIPQPLVAALGKGLANDRSFMQWRPWHLVYLTQFFQMWKRLPQTDRDRYLQDPWAFKDLCYSINTKACQNVREILLFFVHPETFEIISLRKHKQWLLEAFGGRVSHPTGDIDGDLLQIRESFNAELGKGFSYYSSPEMKAKWQHAKQPDDESEDPEGNEDAPTERTPKARSSATAPSPQDTSDTSEQVAADLLLPVDFVERTVELLRHKRQMILYGPPGTGKTYVAQRLAQFVARAPDRVRLVQFHPSYTYEDFFEGYRPSMKGGQPGFHLTPGPLREIAEQATDAPDKTFVVVIDEINRGNVAKVFGEMYFLLEYRDHAIRTQYSKDQFTLPENLLFIGTMNTADRSIALMDAALRRRFYFVEFFPDRPPVEGLLKRWLEKHRRDMVHVADLVERLNHELGDRQSAVGPSHFMKKDLDERWLSLIWDHAVMPHVEERFFGDEARIAAFKLDVLRRGLLAAAGRENL